MAQKKCSFCGDLIEPGSGIMFVKKNGTIYYFCSRKCKTNMLDLKRAPRKIKWTGEYHRLKALSSRHAK